MPALLTRMSIRPPSTEVASRASAREASGLPSRFACTNSARPPRDRIPSTTSLPRRPLRPETTTCLFGAGPGVGRSVALRVGRGGFQVALVARNQTRLDAYTGELAADGITA